GRVAAMRPAVGVDPDLLADRPAKQVIDRLAERLADDVPQGLLEAALGRVEVHRAALAEEIVVDAEGEVLDLEWVAPDQVALQLVDGRLDGLVAVDLGVTLAPAMNALV